MKDQYKILIDSYYIEANLFYSKSNNFMALQLAIFGALLATIDKISCYPFISRIGLTVLILITIIQILVYIRGYYVLQTLLKMILKFENKNNFSLLQDFNVEIKNQNNFLHIKKLNFPSLAVILINIVFLLAWISIFIYLELI